MSDKVEPMIQLNKLAVVDGKKWIAGSGPTPAEFLFVGDKPDIVDDRTNEVFSGPGAKILFDQCRLCGFNIDKSYFTNAVKYMVTGTDGKSGTPTAKDIKLCNATVQAEITRAEAKTIVCLGAVALKAVVGNKFGFSDYRGIAVDHPTMVGVKVFPMFSPGYILRNPEALPTFVRDLQTLTRIQRNETLIPDKTDFVEIKTVVELRIFIEQMFAMTPNPLIALDAEWNGVTWMDPNRYIRTVQLAYNVGKAAVIVFTETGGTQVMDNPKEAWRLLKEFLEDPRVGLIGHNIIADGEWLYSYGVDLRKRTVYDTMLAEHTFNESGPFGLEELTAKYTNLGAYHIAVMKWKDDHPAECIHGYGMIPSWLLHPYGAVDADTTFRIAIAQYDQLAPFMKARGAFPSLWKTALETQKAIYELELTGMKVDPTRLSELMVKYSDRLGILENLLKTMAMQLGMKEFNHRATADVRKLLFEYAGLQPIQDTKGKKWNSEGIGSYHLGAQVTRTPSTDKTTKEILQDKHPVAKMLLQVSRIDAVVKFFLKDDEDADESSKGGGIASKVWPDGRLHPHFSQLSETGRFRHSKPNVANWPKKGEGFMVDIFGGKDKVPPMIRTIIVPEDGYVIMEGDFIQAELFVLAALSGDAVMWDALTTPGKDLHDLISISSFKLNILDANDNLVDPNFLLDMAKNNMKAFKEFQGTLKYRTLGGKILTRKEFKDTLRVAGKAVNFGVCYGRGAAAIALQIKAETGTSETLDTLTQEAQQTLDTWKNETYTSAWGYMMQCADAVEDPGYLVNPWGRMRHFAKTLDRDKLAGMKREAMNFPIQSTVADTCMLAMWRMRQYREAHNLHFRMINQIHDAIMLEVPIAEIEATKVMYMETMGNIDIPILNGPPLRLGVDIDVLTRWGEKKKD